MGPTPLNMGNSFIITVLSRCWPTIHNGLREQWLWFEGSMLLKSPLVRLLLLAESESKSSPHWSVADRHDSRRSALGACRA
jgi:hypothetical protein